MGLTDDRRVPLSDFLPVLFALVPGISSPLGKQWLLVALANFCRDSHVWREVVAEDETPDADNRIELLLPNGTDCAGFICCIDAEGEEIAGVNFTMVTPRIIEFVPDFKAEGVIKVVASLMPTPRLTAVPETLYNRYSQHICHGAAADLVAMDGYEWSNPARYQMLKQKFQQGISEAMRFAVNGYQTQSRTHRLERRKPFF